MEFKNPLKTYRERRTREAISQKALSVTMDVFDHLEESGDMPISVKLGETPRGILKERYIAGVKETVAHNLESTPRYAGRLMLDPYATFDANYDNSTVWSGEFGQFKTTPEPKPEGVTLVFSTPQQIIAQEERLSYTM